MTSNNQLVVENVRNRYVANYITVQNLNKYTLHKYSTSFKTKHMHMQTLE